MVPKTCPEFVFATKNILGGVVQNLKSGSFISVSRCCLDVENDKNLLIIEKKINRTLTYFVYIPNIEAIWKH